MSKWAGAAALNVVVLTLQICLLALNKTHQTQPFIGLNLNGIFLIGRKVHTFESRPVSRLANILPTFSLKACRHNVCNFPGPAPAQPLIINKIICCSSWHWNWGSWFCLYNNLEQDVDHNEFSHNLLSLFLYILKSKFIHLINKTVEFWPKQ